MIFSITSAILEVTSAVAYFVVDKSVRGLGRIIFGSYTKPIEYDESYLLISEVNINDKPIQEELNDVRNELSEIKKILLNKPSPPTIAN